MRVRTLEVEGDREIKAECRTTAAGAPLKAVNVLEWGSQCDTMSCGNVPFRMYFNMHEGVNKMKKEKLS